MLMVCGTVRKYAIDLSPLKKYRDFKLLWSAGLFSYFGSMITFVALPFQIKELTNLILDMEKEHKRLNDEVLSLKRKLKTLKGKTDVKS